MILSLLHLVFSVFVFFLALSFFGISIQSIVNSSAGQENLSYLVSLAYEFWQWASAWVSTKL